MHEILYVRHDLERKYVFSQEYEYYHFILKGPPQIVFLVSVISNKFCEKSNLPSIHCSMLAFFAATFICSFL